MTVRKFRKGRNVDSRSEAEKYPVSRSCPVCGGREAKLLQLMEFAGETGCVLPNCYRIVTCRNCGFVYDDVDVEAGIFEQYYRNCAKYAAFGVGGAGELTAADRLRYRALVEFVSSVLTAEMTIADVGCGKGGLLRFLYENGFKRVVGIEPSPGCVEIIRNHLKLEAVCSDISSLQSGRQFDLVIASNVLEHIFNLRDAVGRLSGLVAAGGLIALEVPDASRYVQFPHAPYYYFDMEHINHFDLNSMRSLWLSAGFEIVAEEEATGFPVEGMEIPMCRLLVRKRISEAESGQSALLPVMTSERVRQYIEWSQGVEQALPGKPENRREFFLWGCGAYAKWFLRNKISAESPAGIVEVNAGKVGALVDGCPVISPEMLLNRNSGDGAVMISSVLYERQIHRQLKELGWRGAVLSACRAQGKPEA